MKILVWFQNNKKKTWKVIFYLSLVFFLLALFLLSNLLINQYYKKTNGFYYQKNKTVAINKVDNDCVDCSTRAIDGVQVKKDSINPFPLAVMIDNHPDARPAYGLSRANLVIEAEAEGGITRYLAIFANNDNIPKIGPIRSIRPYFLAWAEEYSSLVVHCGGSPEALANIIKNKTYDLNEFYNGKYFWRDKNILAPHNIFTSSNNLLEYLNSKNLTSGDFLSWPYSNDNKNETPKNLEIKINYFSTAVDSFEVIWKYNISNKQYDRYLDGKIYLDGEGDGINAVNIIVQYIKKEVVDEKLRLEIKTLGSDKAILCKLGQCQEGNWKKDNKKSRTKFYLSDGSEYNFFPGTTWIEVVDKNIPVSY